MLFALRPNCSRTEETNDSAVLGFQSRKVTLGVSLRD